MSYTVTQGSGVTMAADQYGTPTNVASGQQVPFLALASGVLGSLALNTVSNPSYFQVTDGTNGIKSASAANLVAKTSANAMLVSEPGQWVATHAPAVNTQATCSIAAGGAGVRNLCQAVSINLAAGSSAPSATQLTVNLRDGASGAGSVLATWTIAIPATAGAFASIQLSGLNIPGSANTAMTLEYALNGGANTFESVTMAGTTCS